mgnify:CR=1 FL=1
MIEARDREIIDRITFVRMRNNEHWMRIVEIALEHAPDKTKDVLRQINHNDRNVSDLLKDLAQ